MNAPLIPLARAVALVATATMCTTCALFPSARGASELERVAPDAPNQDPSAPLARRWLLRADPLWLFSGRSMPPGRRVQGALSTRDPEDLALAPGDQPVRLGGAHASSLDTFALTAHVRGVRGPFLRHVTRRGVDLELGVDDSGFYARVGGQRVGASVRPSKDAWHQVAVVVDDSTAELIVDGRRVRTEQISGEVELGAGGWLEVPSGQGAIDEVAFFDEAPHATLFMRSWIQGTEVFSLEQLAPTYNRPDLVLPTLGAQDPAHMEHLRASWARRLHWLGLTPEPIESNTQTEAPRTRVVATQQEGSVVTLRVRHASSPDDRTLATRRAERTHTVTLSPGTNTIEVSSFNTRGVESRRRAVTFEWEAKDARPRLFFVGLGVSEYQDPGIRDLRFADDDVEDMDDWLRAHHGASGFSEYVPIRLTGSDATAAGLERARALLDTAREADMVVVMVSGHGMYSSGASPRYFFLTYDTDLSDVASTAISMDDLEGLLVGTRARRRLMLMDTCQSGDALSSMAAPRTDPGEPGEGALPRAFDLTVTAQVASEPRAWLYERRFVNRDLAWRTGAMVLSSSQGFASSLPP